MTLKVSITEPITKIMIIIVPVKECRGKFVSNLEVSVYLSWF